jgi:hypothetical protein
MGLYERVFKDLKESALFPIPMDENRIFVQLNQDTKDFMLITVDETTKTLYPSISLDAEDPHTVGTTVHILCQKYKVIMGDPYLFVVDEVVFGGEAYRELALAKIAEAAARMPLNDSVDPLEDEAARVLANKPKTVH